MKKLIFTLLFSTLVFSSPSYADWTSVSRGKNKTHYADFDKISKRDGYVYYWYLVDYLKPTKQGNLSVKVYMQGDCKLFRVKGMNDHYYKGSMGSGVLSGSDITPDKEWWYVPPDSITENILKKVCTK